jgi:hypothetical protein
MSPTLLKKYLSAAREVASHMYLKEKGFAFARHPMLVETDRDKFAVHQIIDFYHQQNIDYADYFQTAWRFRHRKALGQPEAKLAGLAPAYHVSARYLQTVWSTLWSTRTLRSGVGRFCSVFPDMFYQESRGRNYFRTGKDEGRYLSAGFHNVMGYFRDDQPLYELLLDKEQQATLDGMWRQMDFVASINIRTYVEFAKLGTRGTRDDFKDGEPEVREIEVEQIISEANLRKLEADYLKVAEGGSAVAIQAVKDFFGAANEGIRWVKRARHEAEPSHLQSLFDFAARAYRRPLTAADRADLLSFYRDSRERYGLDHEGAVREAIVLVLTSPNFSYRVDLIEAGGGMGDALGRAYLETRSEVVGALADGCAAWLHSGSRVSGDVQARFCERLGVRLPGPTHLIVLTRSVKPDLAAFITSKLEHWMGLEINLGKTRILDLRQKRASLDFLGYTFRRDRDLFGRRQQYWNVFPSQKAQQRERQVLYDMTGGRHCFKPLPNLIGELNRQRRGWANYFSFGFPRRAFNQLNRYVLHRLWQHLRRRSQRRFRPPEAVSEYEYLLSLGLELL